MDHYQLLGVSRNCGRKELHEAFRLLSRRYHPDRFDEASRPEAEKKYQKFVIAFNILKDSKQRSKYDRRLQSTPESPAQAQDPAILAEKYFSAGVTRSQQKQYEAAIECFKRANHYFEDAETFYRLGLAESNSEKHKRNAVSHLQKAVQLRPDKAKYHVAVLKLYMDLGMINRAKSGLEKPLSLFPEDEELRALARTIDPKKYKISGFFGNLFGK